MSVKQEALQLSIFQAQLLLSMIIPNQPSSYLSIHLSIYLPLTGNTLRPRSFPTPPYLDDPRESRLTTSFTQLITLPTTAALKNQNAEFFL